MREEFLKRGFDDEDRSNNVKIENIILRVKIWDARNRPNKNTKPRVSAVS